MKKKLSPILAALLVVLAVLFGLPMDGPEAGPVQQPSQTEALPVFTEPGALWQEETGETQLPEQEEAPSQASDQDAITEDGSYTEKEDVALYLHTYGCLPQNFMTKEEARDLGWEGGSLEPYAPGMCIGGDRFGNYEGLLPDAPGRTWRECDIDTLGRSSRGAKRIVFSNDGLVYYTDDHYESFTLLYGEP